MPPDISVKELQNAQFDLYTYIQSIEQNKAVVQPIIIYFLCYKSKLLSINKRQNNVDTNFSININIGNEYLFTRVETK